MYFETKKTGLTIAELIQSIPEVRKDSGDIFPYTKEVCQCRYCAYCQKGKCSLKQCCCMDDRIKAHNCSIAEVLRYCFSNIFSIMTEQKGNQHEKIKIPMAKIKQYFPENEVPSRVEAKIIAALEFYQQYHRNPPAKKRDDWGDR